MILVGYIDKHLQQQAEKDKYLTNLVTRLRPTIISLQVYLNMIQYSLDFNLFEVDDYYLPTFGATTGTNRQ